MINGVLFRLFPLCLYQTSARVVREPERLVVQLSASAPPLAPEMASFSNAGFGAEPEEQAGLMGKASELAKGLRHPMPALFHVLFKVRHAPQARTHTARQRTQSPCPGARRRWLS